MNIGDWITLSAVIVALVLGIWANIQTQQLKAEEKKKEEREKKEQILNEIKEWCNNLIAKTSNVLITSSIKEDPRTFKMDKLQIFSEQSLNLDLQKVNLLYFKVLTNECNPDIKRAIISLEPIIQKLKESLFNLAKLSKLCLTTQEPDKKALAENYYEASVEEMIANLVELNISIETICTEVAKAKLALLKNYSS
jgi:hypothetical protein